MTSDTTYDVAIIGGGFAGLTAANRIAEDGLRPLVLEAGADELYVCNSRVATGALHVAYLSPEEPADTLFDAAVKASDGDVREDLMRAIADRAAATMDWMRARGAEFEEHPRRVSDVPMLAPLREMRAGLDWEDSGPNQFLQLLGARLAQKGGELRRGARAMRILTEAGRVAGIEFETADGRKTVAARAVVVADGGFQANTDLVARHIQPAADRIRQRNTQTGRGDGIRMATAIGAATVGMDKFYGHVLSRDAMTDERLWPYPQLDVLCAKSIVVAPDGRRFADEGNGGVFFANAIVGLDDPLSATAVFDAAGWEDAKTADIVPPNPSMTDNGGTLITADTLDGLAAAAKIDPAGLADTVAAYNAAIAAGDMSGLAPKRNTAVYEALPIAEPPFHAVPLCAGITVTSGGLSVDGMGRVLDRAGRPVPGLYAAGSAVGGIEGGPRVGYVGGLIKAFAIGLIAGDSIVEAACG
ncbi:MAG: FAD-dependent oxidoreductase [Alphaproteobacteria bacterium]